MKKYIIIVFGFILFSCKSNQISPKNSLISYSKNPCFKNCEVYDLHIYNNGNFVYNGVLNVAKKGTYKGFISKELLEKLKEEVKKYPKENIRLKGRDISSITVKYSGFNNTFKSSDKRINKLSKLSEEIIASIP